jgi:hypothetical protein
VSQRFIQLSSHNTLDNMSSDTRMILEIESPRHEMILDARMRDEQPAQRDRLRQVVNMLTGTSD